MMGGFEKNSLSFVFKDRKTQWKFQKVKIRESDCPKELFSKVIVIVNRSLNGNK